MTHFDDQLPEDLRDVAQRLTASRATFTPLELDAMRSRIGRSPQRRRFAGLRMRWTAALLSAGLMLTSGAGVVIASSAIGGGRQTFDDTHFRGGGDDNASRCQYHGRHEEYRIIYLPHGKILVIITFDCHHVIIHIGFPGRFGWGFGGRADNWSNDSWDGDAPSNAAGLTLNAGGSSVQIPLNP